LRLPRWTVWPALVVLAIFLFPALPRRAPRAEVLAPETPATAKAVPAPTHKRVVVLGIDGMDPDILQEAVAKFPDHMQNFARLIREGGAHRLETSTPPQSPVAWSCFITGLDPGGHGVFDFIHRDPVTRGVATPTTKSSPQRNLELWGNAQLPLGGDVESNRSGDAFWKILGDHGVPADIWRMPANFPVEPSKGLSFSGMMTPAVDSAYGESKRYTTDLLARESGENDKTIPVREFDGRIDTYLRGPVNPFRKDGEHATTPLVIRIDHAANAAAIDTGSKVFVLRPGEWSDFARISFSMGPLGISSVAGIVRFYLKSLEPTFELYASPVNIDPIDPVAPVSAPKSASRVLAESVGLYYTQGMPEDVNALKDHALDDREFMAQSQLVHDEGVRILDHALDRWLANQDGGFLFFYFSGVDLCSHMMWRHFDEAHPNHDAKFAGEDSSAWSKRPGSEWKDVVYDLYMRMDPVLGRLRERLPDDALLVVMSDHGFKSYRRKFSLNTWLLENGYLVLKPGQEKELPRRDPAFARVFIATEFGAVDWSKTRAYGVGFNGLYLNLAGREGIDEHTSGGEPGIVKSGAEAEALLAEIRAKLEALVDEKTGNRVVLRCDVTRAIYHGDRIKEAPDLVVGYNAEYDNSDPSSLGEIPNAVLEDNLGGTFNGSHLMCPDIVPGVLLTNGAVLPGPHGLEDLTVEILKQYGLPPANGMRGKPVLR
jgi:predicted AlkP superfamily phosphohydrolase/phosphomutase